MNTEDDNTYIGSKLKHIVNSHLLFNSHKLLLQSKRQLILLDLLHESMIYSKFQEEPITHAAYHEILQVYLILTNKYCIIMNIDGQIINKINNQHLNGSKYIYLHPKPQKHMPNRRMDKITFIKGDNVYQADVWIQFELGMIKNQNTCNFDFILTNVVLNDGPEYIQQAKFFKADEILILWNLHETYIYETCDEGCNLRRLLIYKKVSKRQNRCLDYAISKSSKLMAIGYESGSIKIYQFDDSKKYVTDLKGHQSSCESLLIGSSNPELLYSSSSDNTVRMWNLRHFQQLYILQLDILVDSITLLNEELAFVKFNNFNRTSLCQLNTNKLEPIINDNKNSHLVKITCDEDWCISIYANNYVEFFSITNSQDFRNEKLEYPLKYGTIRNVYRLNANSYAIAIEKGYSLIELSKNQIKKDNFELKKLVYNESIMKEKVQEDEFIELIHEKLLGSFLFHVISDWKNIPNTINVTAVYFHRNSNLPMWDNLSNIPTQPSHKQSHYAVLGTDKGHIYFIDIQKRTHFHIKVSFHSDQIQSISQIVIPNSHNKLFFMSISKCRQINIWSFSHNEAPNVLVGVNYNILITFIEVFQNFIVVGEREGDLSILEVSYQNGEIKMKKSFNSAGHLKAIICGDYLKYKSNDIFLTGGEDSAIKIWRGAEKELIFELKLFGIINTLSFTRQKLEFIVCHNEQISHVKESKLILLLKADNSLGLTETKIQSKYSLQNIDIKSFFYKEIYPLPESPRKITRFKRQGSIFEELFSDKKHDFHQSNQIFENTEFIRKFESEKKFEKINKFRSKGKRFRVESTLRQDYLQQKSIVLPRLPNKKVSMFEDKSKRQFLKDRKVGLSEMELSKEKSFSWMGRHKG